VAERGYNGKAGASVHPPQVEGQITAQARVQQFCSRCGSVAAASYSVQQRMASAYNAPRSARDAAMFALQKQRVGVAARHMEAQGVARSCCSLRAAHKRQRHMAHACRGARVVERVGPQVKLEPWNGHGVAAVNGGVMRWVGRYGKGVSRR